jgi:hypothetical protein
MARQFNGTEYGITESAIDLSAHSKLTIGMWLWVDTFGNGNEQALNINNSTGRVNIRPNDGSTTAFGSFCGDDAGSVRSWKSFTRPSGAAWHSYVFCYDLSLSTNDFTAAYVDGVSQSLTNLIDNNPGGTFANAQIQVMADSGGSLALAGRLADLFIVGGSLWTSTDASNFNAGRRPNWGGMSAAPTQYWPIDDGSGTAMIGGVNITWSGGSSVADPTGLDPYKVWLFG